MSSFFKAGSSVFGCAALLFAFASDSSAESGRERIASHLLGFLREGGSEALWASSEILPGVPKSAAPTGLLMDIVPNTALAALMANDYAGTESHSTDFQDLLAHHKLFLRMRIYPDALEDRGGVFEKALKVASGPDSLRSFPVVVMAMDYDRVDWKRVYSDETSRIILPTLRTRFYCASTPSPGSLGESVRFEFNHEYFISNIEQEVRSVLVSHGSFSRETEFPGTVTVPRLDSSRFLKCRFTFKGGDSFMALMDLNPL